MPVFQTGGVYVAGRWYDTDEAEWNADGSTASREYKLWRKGQVPLEETDALLAVGAATPLLLGNRIRRNIALKRQDLNLWFASVKWETFKPQDHKTPGFEETIRGSTAGKTVQITQAIEHIESYNENGPFPPAFANHGGALNVSQNNGDIDVKPIDIVVPSLDFTIDRSFPPGSIDDSYISTLYNLTGKVNKDDFRGFEAGELLFLGADFVLTDLDNETVSFQFSASPNVTNYTIGKVNGAGGIAISKKGHEYLWTEHSATQKVAGGKKQIRAKLVAAHVEKVYEESDFSVLGI